MTFAEKYQLEDTWDGKVLIMNLYHLARIVQFKGWTLANTAQEFNVSIGLVSENIRLANAINADERILKCKSRQEALKKLNGTK